MKEPIGTGRGNSQAMGARNRMKAYALVEKRTTNGPELQIELLVSSNACLRRHLVQFSHRLKQVHHLAYYDELTGLPNRSLLMDRLQQAMQLAARNRKQVLLLFVDLDQFKWVNDKMGHAAGDSLLKQVALRLAASIRGADTACRYGGDEFVVMLPEIEGLQSVASAMQKIRAQLAAPYSIDGQVVALTASIGAAIYRGDEQSCEDLIQQADLQMYHAKVNSKLPTIYMM